MANRTPQTIADAILKMFNVTWRQHLFFKQSMDDWAIKQKWHNYKMSKVREVQTIDVKAHAEIGSDLAVARFVTDTLGGTIRNEKGHWIRKKGDLPPEFVESFKVTSIKAKKSGLIDEGIDNFVGLNKLESIDLSANPKLDDFACDQLARQFRSSKTLTEIDISDNPHISLYGLDVLFRIPSIKRIIALNTLASEHQDVDLFVVCAEDERNVDVYVHSGGNKYKNPELEALRADTRLRIASQ